MFAFWSAASSALPNPSELASELWWPVTQTWKPCPPSSLLVCLKMQGVTLVTEPAVGRVAWPTPAFLKNMVVLEAKSSSSHNGPVYKMEIQSLYSDHHMVKIQHFPPSPAGEAAENNSCNLQVDYERYPSMLTVCQLNKP